MKQKILPWLILFVALLLPVWWSVFALLPLLYWQRQRIISFVGAFVFGLSFGLGILVLYLNATDSRARCNLPEGSWTDQNQLQMQPIDALDCPRSRTAATILPDGYRSNGRPQPPNAKSFALMFGCSFTFGIDLNDNETIPAFLESIPGSSVRALNFGVAGGGIIQAHSLYQAYKLRKPEIRETYPEATLVYSLLPDHIERFHQNGVWKFQNPFELEATALPDGRWRIYQSQFSRIRNKFIRWKMGRRATSYFVQKYAEAFIALESKSEAQKNEELGRFALFLNNFANEFYQDFPRGRFVVNELMVADYYQREFPDLGKIFQKLRAQADTRIEFVQLQNQQSLPRLAPPNNLHFTAGANRAMAHFLRDNIFNSPLESGPAYGTVRATKQEKP